MPIDSGTRLGPYEIVAPLGAGGMGEVFRARDTRLDRSVALKVVSREFAERFEREARAISQLNHPHICTLYDIGHENGTSFLVMELLEGETLADRLRRGALPLEQVLRYGVQIGDALHRAHKAGIVHRDLKPGNIMITKSGAKLLDFGLAKTGGQTILSAQDGQTGLSVLHTEHKPLTQEGTIIGTFQYMAPEQLEGEEADARTDIFGFGCVLYEMATGRRAFEGKTKTSLIAAIVSSEPPPISQIQPLTPPALEHVIRKCLSKDREDRWQSVHDVAEELRWISESGSQAGVAAPVIATRRQRERLLWIAALIGGIAATAALLLYLRPRPEPVSYRFLLPQPDGGYSRGTWPLLSPDGKQVAFYARSPEGVRKLYVRRLDDFTFRAYDIPVGQQGEAFWSPDGTAIASAGQNRILRIDLRTGTSQAIADVPNFQNGAWSENGTILLGRNEASLMQVPANGGVPVEITKPDRSKFEVGHHAPVFLPGGKRFLFITFTRNPAKPDSPHTLYAGQLGSSEITKVGEVTSKVRYARGYLFYVRGGSLVAVPFDAERLRFTGEPVVVSDRVGFFQPTGAANFSVASDGTVAWSPRPEAERILITDAGGKLLQSIGASGDFSASDVSPDGANLVISKRDLSNGTFDLWMYGITRPTTARVTFEASEERRPVWSADGTMLYYGSDRKGVPDVYAKRLDSSDNDLPIIEGAGEQEPTDASTDGQYLLYMNSQGDTETRGDIFAVSLRDGRSFPVVRAPGNQAIAKFSPDSKWVAYMNDASGRLEIWLKPFPGAGAARQVSTNGGREPRWSRDGKILYYISGPRDLMQVDVAADGSTSDPRLVFPYSEEISDFQPLPNGRFLLVAVDEKEASPSGRVIVRWPDSVAK